MSFGADPLTTLVGMLRHEVSALTTTLACVILE
jgi:hypothetical protein